MFRKDPDLLRLHQMESFKLAESKLNHKKTKCVHKLQRVIHYLLNLQNLSFANIAKITPACYFAAI